MSTLLALDSLSLPCVHSACWGFPELAMCSLCLLRIPCAFFVFTVLAVDSMCLLCVHSACCGFHVLALCSLCLLWIPCACFVFTLLAVDSLHLLCVHSACHGLHDFHWFFFHCACLGFHAVGTLHKCNPGYVIPYLTCFGACLNSPSPAPPHTHTDAQQIATCTHMTIYLCLHCIFIWLRSNCIFMLVINCDTLSLYPEEF